MVELDEKEGIRVEGVCGTGGSAVEGSAEGVGGWMNQVGGVGVELNVSLA